MNVYPPTSTDDYRADCDTRQIRLRAALHWFATNNAQIRQRARAGEAVFEDLLKFHAKSLTFTVPAVDGFINDVEIVQAEYGDIVPWPEEVAIARKLER